MEKEQNQTEQQYQQDQQIQQDSYYGGSSMEYNADQIFNYEQGYENQAYDNYYNSFYQGYTQSQAQQDRLMHKEMYQYFKENYETMKESFPKKRRIIRWEQEAENYNSLEAAEEFMDLMGEMQKAEQAEQEALRKQAKEFEDIY